MTHIEFMGLPGSGKSTLRNLLVESLQRGGVPCLSMEEALLSSLRARVDGAFFRCLLHALPHGLALKYTPLIFTRSALRYAAQNAFLTTHGGAISAILTHDAFLSRALPERETMFSWFLLTAAQHQLIHECTEDAVSVIFDEGFLQRSLSLFTSPVTTVPPDRSLLSTYLDNVPRPDLVLYLEVDARTCRDRILTRSRGLPQRLVGKDPAEILSHMENLHGWIEDIVDLAATKGLPISRIDITGSPGDSLFLAEQAVRGAKATQAQG
ncbi:MAG TPA: AAA family ATPase [Deltaproteobacteria bacterium]|nr:AAA family ATPase [Deltaproteobacteria bacterium]HPA08497.1 AAA family ATPase [Methanoregulaceae archaeon]